MNLEQGRTAQDGSGTHAVEIQLSCPKCQGEGTFKTWDCIDASADPALRERLLHDPMLFFYFCPKCFSRIRIDAPCLYIDRQRQFMVWLVPDTNMEMSMEELQAFFGTGDYSNYRCRTVRSWGEWREKIIEMESRFDDRLFEFVKYGSFYLLKEEEKKQFYLPAYHVEYADDDEKTDELALIFMKDDEEKSTYSYPISQKMMEVSQDIFQPLMDRIPELSGRGTFQRYDYDWAKLVINHLLETAMNAGEDDKGSLKNVITLWFQGLGQEIFQAELTPRKD